MPDVLDDYKSRVAERWVTLRSLGLRGLIPLTGQEDREILTSNVLPRVIDATRLTLALVALGLLLVGVSIAVPSTLSMFPEYFAAFSFSFALAFTLAGILRAEREWFRHSVARAAKWIASFMLVATLFGFLGLFADDIVNAAKAIIKIAFTGLILLAALYVALGRRFRRRRPRGR
jgi:drug/metabolite transporter (DMT)-like permease